MRRAEPLHPAALLVDQDRGVVAADDLAKICNKRATCVGRLDVALEQDQAPRAAASRRNARSSCGERRAGQAGDESARRHRRGLACAARAGSSKRQWHQLLWTTHWPPAAFRLLQSWIACSRRGERSDHGAVVGALVAEIGAADHGWRSPSTLEYLACRLRNEACASASLRCEDDLHQIAAVAGRSAGAARRRRSRCGARRGRRAGASGASGASDSGALRLGGGLRGAAGRRAAARRAAARGRRSASSTGAIGGRRRTRRAAGWRRRGAGAAICGCGGRSVRLVRADRDGADPLGLGQHARRRWRGRAARRCRSAAAPRRSARPGPRRRRCATASLSSTGCSSRDHDLFVLAAVAERGRS